MQITGLTLAQFQACANYVSATKYGGNVIVYGDAHDTPPDKNGTPRCTARLATFTSDGPGTRTTARGKRGRYACWHAYRDVLMYVFERYPGAVIRAGNSWRVTYRGATGFLETYPETGTVNVGSPLSPVTMPELCDCEATDRTERVYRVVADTIQARELAIVDTIRAIGARIAAQIQADPLNDLAETSGEYLRGENADYVSPAVGRASRAYAASAQLLGEGDKPADPWVFGPEDGPKQNIYYS